MFRRPAANVAAKAPAPALPDGPVDSAWFDVPVCRNCGAGCSSPYCAQCGQKFTKRIVWRDVWRESWDRLRLFEMQSASTLCRLILTPGKVARDYVLGRRTVYMHPLKLLVLLVATLVLILSANGYFGTYAVKHDDVDRMAQRVMAYANWSFSLGIFAIFLGSLVGFRRRLDYNAIEHAVLAVYCQSIILGLVIINLLPTLIWRDAAFVLWHKTASQYYIPAAKLLIVGFAYKQFFLLDPKSDWARLLLACVIYAAINWLLLRAYATAILWLVT